MLSTPILFIVFNRTDTSEKVFEEIRKAKPHRLYVAADGPRPNIPTDIEECTLARGIVNLVDWNCEVKTFFKEENLGPGKFVSSAITWFFDNEEQGIILEHDCLPHPDFFPYCEELLERYKKEEIIKTICGSAFYGWVPPNENSYYFSNYVRLWGWATWRRVWQEYDFPLTKLNKKRFNQLLKERFKLNTRLYWLDKYFVLKSQYRRLKLIQIQNINTWDYQVLFSMWDNGGLSIIPNTNIVKNIGFGDKAIHTKNANSPDAKIELNSILPIKHPNVIKADKNFDLYPEKTTFHKCISKNILRITYHFLYYVVAKVNQPLE